MDCDPERIWKIIDNNRQNMLPLPKSSLQSQLSLHDKLYKSYASHPCGKGQPLRSAVNLLKKLDPATTKPSFLLNLYDDADGYSIALCYNDGDECIQLYLPYEEDYIFSYLDNQEIPPLVVELLDGTECFRLQDGYLICEVRNYRGNTNGYHSASLLLHQNSENLSSASSRLSSENLCSQKEEVCVESHLVLATQSPICLDPSTDVTCLNSRLYYNKLKFNSQSVKGCFKKKTISPRSKVGQVSAGLEQYFTTRREHSKGRRRESLKKRKSKLLSSDIIKGIIDDVSRLVPPIDSNSDAEDIEEQSVPPAQNLHKSDGELDHTDSIIKSLNHDNHAALELQVQLKTLPPLNVYQPVKILPKNQLPKLHPLSNEQKLLLAKKTVQLPCRQSPPLPSTSMPRLHKID